MSNSLPPAIDFQFSNGGVDGPADSHYPDVVGVDLGAPTGDTTVIGYFTNVTINGEDVGSGVMSVSTPAPVLAGVAGYQLPSGVWFGLVHASGLLDDVQFHQGDIIVRDVIPGHEIITPYGTASAYDTYGPWRLATPEEIMAVARKQIVSQAPVTGTTRRLGRLNSVGATKFPPNTEGTQTQLLARAQRMLVNYNVARVNAQIAGQKMSAGEAELKTFMETSGIKEVVADDLVAHFPRKKSKGSRTIAGTDLYEALGQDDEKFYACTTVALGKLAEFLTEPEIAAISTETPGKLKDPAFAIEPIDEKTMT